ncbi:MAG: FAD-dependent oxidoreductase [Candidatus Omnitrophica bacterium]|nr:FAD-dependent oxidoreductase [Candidatus Omnitrophota bacterium]
MGEKKIGIIGAGLSGLSTAWHLQKSGVDCRIFEKEQSAGGLCRSKLVKGFTFDYDGHLLHFKHDHVFRLLKAFLGKNLDEHKRSAWIYSRDRFTRYPFQVNLHGLPPHVVKECLFGFINALNRCPGKKALSFYDWIHATFGEGIARHFMVPYNKKFWTVPLERLTCEWLDGFIPVPTLREILDGTIEESKRQYGYNSRFWYPLKTGIQAVPDAFAQKLRHLYTGCAVVSIDPMRKCIKLSSGETFKYDCLVSSVPLPELPRLITRMPADVRGLFKLLRWNSVFNLNLGVKRDDSAGRHWIYFPDDDISFFRVGFQHNFSGSVAPQGYSSIYSEVSYSPEKPIHAKRMVSRIKHDLIKTGILNSLNDIVIEDCNDIPYGYPIYDMSYASCRRGIFDYLRTHNIFPAGRYGAWRYMSMEDVIFDGQRVAGDIALNAGVKA